MLQEDKGNQGQENELSSDEWGLFHGYGQGQCIVLALIVN